MEQELAAGEREREIAERDGVASGDASKQIRLALLSPDIMSAMLSGTPQAAVAERFRSLKTLPVSWADQNALFLTLSN